MTRKTIQIAIQTAGSEPTVIDTPMSSGNLNEMFAEFGRGNPPARIRPVDLRDLCDELLRTNNSPRCNWLVVACHELSKIAETSRASGAEAVEFLGYKPWVALKVA